MNQSIQNLPKDDDQYSVAESMGNRSTRSIAPQRDEKVNLVGESIPNYARINHFTTDPFTQDQPMQPLVVQESNDISDNEMSPKHQ